MTARRAGKITALAVGIAVLVAAMAWGLQGPAGAVDVDARSSDAHASTETESDVSTAANSEANSDANHGDAIAPVLHPERAPLDGSFPTGIPPALILVLGAVVVPLLPRVLRSVGVVFFPALALWAVWQLPDGAQLFFPFMDYELEVVRADRLSLIFGKIFSLVGIIAGIYSWQMHERKQQVAALLYAAGALGVTFAGDYLTLYAFWELMAVSSTVLIWARRRPDSLAAGTRYVLVHLVGGALLLGGILLHMGSTGSLEIVRFAPGTGGPAAWLILLGFAVNAAIPPLGPWLPDAYPKATVTGAIFCSALTTKTAVYTLLRVFPGWEVLLIAGVIMALYGVVYAVLANDIRELLAYHIISQVGYMVAGCGLGTEMAINGATAHAFSHILYKALLFMGAGVVIQTTGKEKLAELGGFVSRQKLVFGLYMIGAFSISGFPLWNGFISKSMITAATVEDHVNWAYLGLMLASVGTFLHTGLKLPYNTWLGEDKGIQPTRAQPNMVLAMAIAAFFCTLYGVAPGLLYRDLPYAVNWAPYTGAHIMEMVQLLLFTFFAFYVFIPSLGGHYGISIDTDVFYRKPGRVAHAIFVTGVGSFFDWCQEKSLELASGARRIFRNPVRYIPGYPDRLLTDDPDYDEDRSRLPLAALLGLMLFVFLAVALWDVVR